MNAAPDPGREPRVLRALSWAMALQFAVGGAVIPFVTILLQDRGLTNSQISQVFLVSCSTLLVFPFFWGMLADRFLPLERVFLIMNALALVCLGFFSQQTGFAGLLLTFTLFFACFNPTLMLINPLCFHHLHNPREQFGTLRSWGSIGWIAPSLPVFLCLVWRPGANLDFTLMLGIVLAAVMCVFSRWLPHTPPGAAHAGPDLAAGLGYRPAVKRLLRNGNYVVLLAAFFLMAGSFSILILFSPVRMVELGMDRAWVGPVQCVGVLVEVVLFRWRTLFVHRMSYAMTIGIGCAALVARQLLFAFSENLWVLSASYVLAGTVIVFFHIGVSVLVNTMAGKEIRSTAQTLLVLFGSGLGPMCSNAAAGWLTLRYDQSLVPVFLFAAALAGLATLLILVRGPQLDRPASP